MKGTEEERLKVLQGAESDLSALIEGFLRVIDGGELDPERVRLVKSDMKDGDFVVLNFQQILLLHFAITEALKGNEYRLRRVEFPKNLEKVNPAVYEKLMENLKEQ
jgi:hypothetical protein